MKHASLSISSFPRMREPSRGTVFNWVPAFAGMTGVVLLGCGSAGSANAPVMTDKNDIVLLESDFEGRDLIKGMAMKKAMQNLEFLGWHKWDGINVSPSGMANLWIREPCRAAAVEYSKTYKTVSNERPPKHLQLNVNFYECVEDKPVNLGQLAEVNVKEDLYAKNK